MVRESLIPCIVCLLFATGCDEKSPGGPTAPLNQEFTLAPGQTAAIEHTTARVQFIAVTGDSRCPADVVCIQGGDALVHVRVADDAATAEYDLHTGDSARAEVNHGSLRVRLMQLQPYPFSSKPIAPEEYRATLRVQR